MKKLAIVLLTTALSTLAFAEMSFVDDNKRYFQIGWNESNDYYRQCLASPELKYNEQALACMTAMNKKASFNVAVSIGVSTKGYVPLTKEFRKLRTEWTRKSDAAINQCLFNSGLSSFNEVKPCVDKILD